MKTLDALASAASAICVKDTGRSALTRASAHYAARISSLETKLLLLQITEPPALSKEGNIMRVGLTGLCVLPLSSTGDIGTNRIHPWLLTIYQKTA